MIVAVTQNTRESYMKFKKFNLLKKELFSSILAPVLIIAIGVAMLFFNPAFGVICIAVGILLPVTMYVSMLVASKKFLKSNREYLATGTKYEFGEEEVRVTTASPVKEHCVQGTFRYEELHESFETGDSFYFYLTKTRCLILPKSDFVEGSPADLTAILKEKLLPLKKYRTRK